MNAPGNAHTVGPVGLRQVVNTSLPHAAASGTHAAPNSGLQRTANRTASLEPHMRAQPPAGPQVRLVPPSAQPPRGFAAPVDLLPVASPIYAAPQPQPEPARTFVIVSGGSGGASAAAARDSYTPTNASNVSGFACSILLCIMTLFIFAVAAVTASKEIAFLGLISCVFSAVSLITSI